MRLKASTKPAVSRLNEGELRRGSWLVCARQARGTCGPKGWLFRLLQLSVPPTQFVGDKHELLKSNTGSESLNER